MFSLMSIFFPSISLIVLGYVFKTAKILNFNFWDGAEKLNYYILFPALLFTSLAKTETQISNIKQTLIFIIIIIVGTILATYCVAVFQKTPIERIGVYIQSLIRFNTYIGLSIAMNLDDVQIKNILVSILALSIPFVNVISILSLTPKERLNISNILISLFKNPLINSCVLGITWNYFSIDLWKGLDNLLTTFSNGSLMLGLLCVGAAIKLKGSYIDYIKALLISLLRLIIVPVIIILLSSYFIIDKSNLIAIMIFFSIPTASSAYVLTKILNGDHQLMARIISLQTILSVITLPVIIHFIIETY